jgi:hypothetical protein
MHQVSPVGLTNNGSDDDDDNANRVITQMAALTTKSQLTMTTAAETNAAVTVAIYQLNANQQAMQQQFAAFTTWCNTSYQPAPPSRPPITQFTIPNYLLLTPAGVGSGGR